MCCLKKKQTKKKTLHTPASTFVDAVGDILKIMVLVNWMTVSTGHLNDSAQAVWRHTVVIFRFFCGDTGQQKRNADGSLRVHKRLAWTKCHQIRH